MPALPLPNVLITEPIHPAGVAILQQSCNVQQSAISDSPEFLQHLHNADAVIIRSRPFTSHLMAAAPRLRVIGRHGAGIDNIDVEYAKETGIEVVNTPRSNTNSVAEYVITVCLMLLKRLPEVSAALRGGDFSSSGQSLPGQVDQAGLIGREARGRTIGLVGVGAIGLSVAKFAESFGMTVLGYDPYLKDKTKPGFRFVDTLQELLAEADIVSLHIPGGHQNQHLIGAAEIRQMRPGGILINAARGGLVDIEALATALSDGHLAGAAVDVFEIEPPVPDDIIFSAPNLLLTPHMAAMTDEALRRMSVDVALGVVRHLTDISEIA